MPFKKYIVSLLLVLGLGGPLHALEDVILLYDARTQYSGNTTSSLSINGSVIQGNPSLLTRIPKPVLCSGTALAAGQPSPVPNFLGSLVLPLSHSVTLGVALNPAYLANETTLAERGCRVSFALAEKISEQVSLGATFYYDLQTSKPFKDSPFNVKVGISVRPTSQASIAFMVADFLDSPTNKGRRGLASATLGLSYSVKEFVFGLDTRVIPEAGQVNFNAGGETTFLHRLIHVGVGFEYRKFIAPFIKQDSRASPALISSAGIGVTLSRFILDYSISVDLGPNALFPLHELSVSMPL